jgi:hypothetical protein
MSESTRGLIYRGLVVVFFALVVFGVIDDGAAEGYLNTIIEVGALLGFSLAARNTDGVLSNRVPDVPADDAELGGSL